MLVEFDFHVLQLRYVRAAMASIATYKPDGMSVAAMDGVITNAGVVRQAYLDAKQNFDLARGEFREAVNNGHDAAVGVHAAMKSRYRKDPGSLSAIEGLPTQDQTAAETIKRMEQISSLWGKLPQIGTPPAQFVAWQGMDKTAFDALLTAATTKQTALPNTDQLFQVAEGNLHETNDEMGDLVTASLQQGRAQFKSGTEREVIDAIPTEPAQQPPGQAIISATTTPSAGVIHIEFDAPHATSFDVFMKKQADAAYTQVADDTIAHTHDATGLVAGTTYNFKVTGRNSLGNGPESAVANKVAT